MLNGNFPDELKVACITPILKRDSLDKDDVTNFKSDSNLPFLSKLIEKCVNYQITEYVHTNQLFCAFQSSYRCHHSCETAMVKVHNNVVSMLDAKLNVILLLFDYSAAFDTVNHDILLAKLRDKYSFSGTVFAWFASYFSNRRYIVKINQSLSRDVALFSGVRQGSILVPVLFNLYFQESDLLAKSHDFNIHLYADDMQCYCGVDRNVSFDFLNDKIRSFTRDLMGWKCDNVLKLNEKKKTDIIEFSSTFGGTCKLMSTVSFDNDYFIQPATSVKSLGVVLDDGLTLRKHIDKVIGVCYFNLRNMGRIASKLSRTLKIQLIHSLILSDIDHCNALFYNLLEYLLHKLTKVLYAAVRFVFGLRGSARRSHRLPYLKNLRIFPVKFRIHYKVALLTYKCIDGTSPDYLQNLIFCYPGSSYNLRVSDMIRYFLK